MSAKQIFVLAPRLFQVLWVFVLVVRGVTVMRMAQLLYYLNTVRQESPDVRQWVRDAVVPSPTAAIHTMAVQVVVLVVHLFKLQAMIRASTDVRQLCFRTDSDDPSTLVKTGKMAQWRSCWSQWTYHRPVRFIPGTINTLWMSVSQHAVTILNPVMRLLQLFEIDNEWFEEVFVARETVELLLQVVQVSRITLLGQSGFFTFATVAAVFIKGVSAVVIENLSTYYQLSTCFTRLVSIVTDAFLDFAFATGIPLGMAMSFFLVLDPVRRSFGAVYLDDHFITRFIFDMQFISWCTSYDVLCAVVFHCGLIICLEYAQAMVVDGSTLERPLSPTTCSRSHQEQQQGTSTSFVHQNNSHNSSSSLYHSPRSFGWKEVVKARSIGHIDLQIARHCPGFSFSLNPKTVPRPSSAPHMGGHCILVPRQRLLRLMSYLHAIVGIVVLAASLHARFFAEPAVASCKQPAYQWFSSHQSCLIFEVNCYRRHITGSSEDIDTALSEVDPQYLHLLLVAHCPALSISDSIRRLRRLHTLEVYNSTLLDWPKRASLEVATNPNIRNLRFMSVKFTNGQLPVGVHHAEMSATLGTVFISDTNLRELPNDLHESWRNLDTLVLSKALLPGFPKTITNMPTLTSLLLENQLIHEIPRGALDQMELLQLSLQGNPIDRIPEAMPRSVLAKSCRIDLTRTFIRTIPPWLESLLRSNQHASPLLCFVETYQSPLCSNRVTRSLVPRDSSLSSINWLLSTCFKDDDKTSYSAMVQDAIRKQRVL